MNLSLVETLQGVGFTLYESKAISACIGAEEATATEIASRAGIPVTKVYSVLKALENRGILESGFERPKKYSCLNLEGLKQKLAEEKAREQQRIMRALEENQQSKRREGETSVFWGKGELKKRIGRELKNGSNLRVLFSKELSEKEFTKPYLLRKAYKRMLKGESVRLMVSSTPRANASMESLAVLSHENCLLKETVARASCMLLSDSLGVIELSGQEGETVGGIQTTDQNLLRELNGYYELIWEQAGETSAREKLAEKRKALARA